MEPEAEPSAVVGNDHRETPTEDDEEMLMVLMLHLHMDD